MIRFTLVLSQRQTLPGTREPPASGRGRPRPPCRDAPRGGGTGARRLPRADRELSPERGSPCAAGRGALLRLRRAHEQDGILLRGRPRLGWPGGPPAPERAPLVRARRHGVPAPRGADEPEPPARHA